MSADILDTKREFIIAAASYFGINPDQVVQGSHVSSNADTLDLHLAIALTPDDMIGIANRMKNIAQDASVLSQAAPEQESQPEPAAAVTYEDVARNPQAFKDAGLELDKLKQLEDAGVCYTNLSASEKSLYGSRRNYVLHIARTLDDIEALSGREVKHITTEQEPDDKVEFVWLAPSEVTEAQRQFACEVDATGNYAINVQMLTQEQRTRLGMDEGGLPG